MTIKEKILIVEDEPGIAVFIAAVLAANGYDPITARTGAEALSMVTSHCPSVMLLDLGLPDMDGLEIVRSVRAWSHLPIVVVSARTQERDKVAALDLGADDYIIKPFGTDELLARIRTAIRHTRTQDSNPLVARSGRFETQDLMIDFDKRKVTVGGESIHMTQNEYKIVALLAKNAGRVLTYDYLLCELWGPAAKGDNQILRVNMANIRRKLEKNPAEPEYIITEVGVGYRMIDSE